MPVPVPVPVLVLGALQWHASGVPLGPSQTMFAGGQWSAGPLTRRSRLDREANVGTFGAPGFRFGFAYCGGLPVLLGGLQWHAWASQMKSAGGHWRAGPWTRRRRWEPRWSWEVEGSAWRGKRAVLRMWLGNWARIASGVRDRRVMKREGRDGIVGNSSSFG